MTHPILPPEWADQSGVMLTWPHEDSDWARWLTAVETVYVDLARHITARQALIITCRDEGHETHIRGLLHAAAVDETAIRLVHSPYNDTWVRDYGPITVLEAGGRARLLDFTFNGWGNKFDARLDNGVTRRLHALGVFDDTPVTTVDLVLEGGSIEVDGAGTLLTTRRCLLAPTRNPELDRPQIEQHLADLLGVHRILWLEHGYLAGDDTDSHIDTLARFCDASTIAYVSCDDPADEHYAELKAMEAELHAFRTLDGHPYRLVTLPWPRAKYGPDGRRLPASYANFLIINGAVLVPTYDDPADAETLARLQTCFTGRAVIGIPSSALIQQYGSVHCITMQLPRGASRG